MSMSSISHIGREPIIDGDFIGAIEAAIGAGGPCCYRIR
jgi:hypothetical protein